MLFLCSLIIEILDISNWRVRRTVLLSSWPKTTSLWFALTVASLTIRVRIDALNVWANEIRGGKAIHPVKPTTPWSCIS